MHRISQTSSLRTKDLLPPQINPQTTQGAVLFYGNAHYWLRSTIYDLAEPLLYLHSGPNPQQQGVLRLLPYTEENDKLLLDNNTLVYESTCRVVLNAPINGWEGLGLKGGVSPYAIGSQPKLPERYKKRKEGGLLVETYYDEWRHIPEACLEPNVAARQLNAGQALLALRWDPTCVYTARTLDMKPNRIEPKREMVSATIGPRSRMPFEAGTFAASTIFSSKARGRQLSWWAWKEENENELEEISPASGYRSLKRR